MIFLLFFAIFWDGFLIFFYKMILSGDSVPIVAILIPMLHVGAGVGLTYMVLTGFVNSTVITVESDQLTIKHRPLPWLGNRTLNRNDFIQLYCEEVRNKNGSSYRLNAVLQNHKKLKLISGIQDRSQAIYFEREIERFMGIDNVHVDGEM
jgi:hypothetical protein